MLFTVHLEGAVIDLLEMARATFGEPDVKEAYCLAEMYPTKSIDTWLFDWRTYKNAVVNSDALDALRQISEKHTVIGLTLLGAPLTRTIKHVIEGYGIPVDYLDVGSIKNDGPLITDYNKLARGWHHKVYLIDSPYNKYLCMGNMERITWKHLKRLMS